MNPQLQVGLMLGGIAAILAVIGPRARHAIWWSDEFLLPIAVALGFAAVILLVVGASSAAQVRRDQAP